MASTFSHSDLTNISKNIISELQDDKLPTKSEVLSLFFYYSKSDQLKTDDVSKLVTEKIKNIWNKIPVRTIETRNCISKIKKLYNDYRSYQKYQNMSDMKIKFLESTTEVFDICHASVFSGINSVEKKSILLKPFDIIRKNIEMIVESQQNNGFIGTTFFASCRLFM